MVDKTQKIPTLSKSRFTAGIQCEKRLYMECYHLDLADPVDANQQAMFEVVLMLVFWPDNYILMVF